ncbi:Dimer-Tnp-hAT dimerization containing protein [Pyrenophora tritici-repentis]|nr:Dimer-Tnp-hAT dimerization containing protein [Pyrenophora tritici-repentis]
MPPKASKKRAPLGEIHDLPIALPQLKGAYTSKAIATAVIATLRIYKITLDTLGYFVLNNASNNDTTIAAALLFGNNKDAYDNAAKHIDDEEAFIAAWRKHGALEASNNDLPAAARVKILQPIKLVVTRWNLYYSALKRATYLKSGFDLYIEKHVSRVAYEERRGTQSDAPAWMRSGGLQAADWAVVTDSFRAIHEVLPMFEYLLDQLEKLAEPYADVKAEEYYRKLDDSPVYYAATCLYPYYKYYCENLWEHKDRWLRTANARFQELWRSYKKAPPSPPPQPARTGAIDDVIEALTARRNCARRDGGDEYDRWLEEEPSWSTATYHNDGNAVRYWMTIAPKYPQLSRFAIDILTIPASSCECERLFSELGDLLEPKRRAISSDVTA